MIRVERKWLFSVSPASQKYGLMIQAFHGADDSPAAPGLYTIYDAYKQTVWKYLGLAP